MVRTAIAESSPSMSKTTSSSSGIRERRQKKKAEKPMEKECSLNSPIHVLADVATTLEVISMEPELTQSVVKEPEEEPLLIEPTIQGESEESEEEAEYTYLDQLRESSQF